VYCGRAFYEIQDIHYTFEEFPDEIQLSNTSQIAKRQRLYLYVPEDSQESFDIVTYNETDTENLKRHFKHRLFMNPHDDLALQIYSNMTQSDRIETLRKGFEHVPILTNWHRAYQDIMELENPDYNLIAEYEGYLEASPEVPAMKYLLGRVTPDPAAAEKLFLAASEGATPFSLGYHAIAYHALCTDQFEKAHKYSTLATKIEPDNNILINIRLQSLVATGRYDEAARLAETFVENYPFSSSDNSAYCILLTMTKDPSPVEAVLEKIKTAVPDTPSEDLELWRNYLTPSSYYAKGDYAQYATAMEQLESYEAAFITAILKNQPTSAAEILREGLPENTTEYLLVYCIAKQSGDDKLADDMLQSAIGLLNEQGKDMRQAARILQHSQLGVSESELSQLMLLPNLKRVFCTALGMAHPKTSEVAFKTARSYNFDPSFPQHLIQRWTTPKPVAQPVVTESASEPELVIAESEL
ncbi:MAG: hypothetical protein AAF571_14855, partial [Verrucomicrobiota bacterium]